MVSNEKFYDRSVKNPKDSDRYDLSGESEYTRERADPYQMIDYLIDQEVSFRGAGPKNYQRSDQRIFEDVAELLFRNPEIDASEIEISVQNGEVLLRGHVSSRKIKRLAEIVIDDVRGVKDIYNELKFY